MRGEICDVIFDFLCCLTLGFEELQCDISSGVVYHEQEISVAMNRFNIIFAPEVNVCKFTGLSELSGGQSIWCLMVLRLDTCDTVRFRRAQVNVEAIYQVSVKQGLETPIADVPKAKMPSVPCWC